MECDETNIKETAAVCSLVLCIYSLLIILKKLLKAKFNC